MNGRRAAKVLMPQGVRNRIRPIAYWMGRNIVAAKRLAGATGVFPDFMIIGVQKGGTTFLYDLLVQHPDVRPARTKEIGFFDRFRGRGLGWYQANFPARGRSETWITGEATPDYIFTPGVAERIHAVRPSGTRFIVLLRDPTRRAISHYFHARRLGSERLGIAEAFAAEAQRVGADGATSVMHPLSALTSAHCYSYVSRGFYAAQLRTWFDLFGRENFHVETSERLFAHPLDVVREVYAFLGLADFHPPAVAPRNRGDYAVEVPAALTASIDLTFAEPTRQLEALLGRSLPWHQEHERENCDPA